MSGKCFTLQVEAREQEKHPADLCKKFWISNIYLWNLLNIPIYFHIWEWSIEKQAYAVTEILSEKLENQPSRAIGGNGQESQD